MKNLNNSISVKSIEIRLQLRTINANQMIVVVDDKTLNFGTRTNPLFKSFFHVIDSFEEASAICRSHIEFEGLGGSTWNNGSVYSKDGLRIAYVSYNGRIWKDEKVEIKIDDNTFDKFKEHHDNLNKSFCEKVARVWGDIQ